MVTVFGGAHPTALPEETVREEAVDIVVAGEGEYTLIELVKCIGDGTDFSMVKGLWYKDGTEIRHSPPRKRITNLDVLPFPARHLLNLKAYRPSVMNYRKLPAYTVMCGLGRPNQCIFCSSSKVFGRRVILRSPENIAVEVDYLVKNLGAKTLFDFFY